MHCLGSFPLQEMFYKSLKYLFFEEQNKTFTMNILGPAVIRINCKYSTRSFLFTDIRRICPRAVFFEDPVDLFRESYTLIYKNFLYLFSYPVELMFLELNVQPPLVLLAHRCKCSFLRASLFTVLRVVYAIVRLIQNICHNTP